MRPISRGEKSRRRRALPTKNERRCGVLLTSSLSPLSLLSLLSRVLRFSPSPSRSVPISEARHFPWTFPRMEDGDFDSPPLESSSSPVNTRETTPLEVSVVLEGEVCSFVAVSFSSRDDDKWLLLRVRFFFQ